MAAETASIRDKTRRVKDHILTRYLAIASKIETGKEVNPPDLMLYANLTETFARNVLPRSVEHGGDPENDTPIPILMNPNVPTHDGDKENSPTLKTD
jgi:hypothetical protein